MIGCDARQDPVAALELCRPTPVPSAVPNCARLTLIAWTLRRDDRTKVVLRTWVCTECQVTQERPEPE